MPFVLEATHRNCHPHVDLVHCLSVSSCNCAELGMVVSLVFDPIRAIFRYMPDEKSGELEER